jgi:hypothetical protein
MTGHIYIVMVLQSCTDFLHILPSSSIETFPTSSGCTHVVGNTEVGEDGEVIEENFTAANREKQEDIPEDTTDPDIKTEPDEVSIVCICLVFRHILPVCSCLTLWHTQTAVSWSEPPMSLLLVLAFCQ